MRKSSPVRNAHSGAKLVHRDVQQQRRTPNGERRTPNGERRTPNGERRTPNGERRTGRRTGSAERGAPNAFLNFDERFDANRKTAKKEKNIPRTQYFTHTLHDARSALAVWSHGV
jgi:hypothetical protein